MYLSSGMFFTNNKLVLCGYNIKYSEISGIGGKKENNETFYETAIRETLEELFEINPNIELIKKIETLIIPKQIIKSFNYVNLVYTFHDLNILLNFLNINQIQSKLYNVFPINISELIFNRKIELANEISHLCLLPLLSSIKISHDFSLDLQLIQI
jgi:hypothetical protein